MVEPAHGIAIDWTRYPHQTIRTPKAGTLKISQAHLNEVKIAYMATANRVGFEVFQFIDPAPITQQNSFGYNEGDFSRICMTDSDPAGLENAVEPRRWKKPGCYDQYRRRYMSLLGKPGRHGEDLERAAGQSNWSLKVARGRKGLKGASINIVYMVLVHCE